MPANPERFTGTEASFAPIHREAMAIVNKEFVVYVGELVKAKANLRTDAERKVLDDRLKVAGLFLQNTIVDASYQKSGRIPKEPQKEGGQQ
jgi:hypothetical protein